MTGACHEEKGREEKVLTECPCKGVPKYEYDGLHEESFRKCEACLRKMGLTEEQIQMVKGRE